MATLQFFTLFVLFSFPLLLPRAAAKSSCGRSQYCNGLTIDFPFQLPTNQSPCVYPGFDLSCENGNQTIITLPSSGKFTVLNINNYDQIISINDPGSCLLRRFLEHPSGLVDNSPFSNYDLYDFTTNYTFLNCSSLDSNWPHLYCLSGDNYDGTVTAFRTGRVPYVPPNCSVISTALIPGSYDMDDSYGGIGMKLSWDTPDCSSCDIDSQTCGLKHPNSLEIRCFGRPIYHNRWGLPEGVKYGIMMGVLLFLVWLALLLLEKVRARGESDRQPVTELSTVTVTDGQHLAVPPPYRQPVTELSTVTVTDGQRSAAPLREAGLDRPTIESYPKTQLGERWELPEPNDKACPICLSEYKSMDTLRTIPSCNHYFHADCVDEWLGKSATCPLCRNLQEKL